MREPGTGGLLVAHDDPTGIRAAAAKMATEGLRAGRDPAYVRRMVSSHFYRSYRHTDDDRRRQVPDAIHQAVRAGIQDAIAMPDLPEDERARENARREARRRTRRDEQLLVAAAIDEAEARLARGYGQEHRTRLAAQRQLTNEVLQAEVVERTLETWRVAEFRSAMFMRALGLRMVEVTPPRNDGGVDVTADGAVAQVKHQLDPVGRPAIQALHGAAISARARFALCLARSGYSAGAVAYADAAGIALFTYDADWTFTPVNPAATKLLQSRYPGVFVRRALRFL
jgi:hypothetical protein